MFILNIILKTTDIFIYVHNQKKKQKVSEYSSFILKSIQLAFSIQQQYIAVYGG